MRKIAESGRLLDVATLLATFARLERDHVFKLIFQGQMQTILILCRSLELSWPTVDAMLAMRAAKQRGPICPIPPSAASYQAVDATTSRSARSASCGSGKSRARRHGQGKFRPAPL